MDQVLKSTSQGHRVTNGSALRGDGTPAHCYLEPIIG